MRICSHFLSNGRNGIHLDKGKQGTQGVTVGGSFRTHLNGGDGITIAGAGCQGRTILAGVSELNNGWGIHIDGGSLDTRVIGMYFESNTLGEILVSDQADGCSLIGVITAPGKTLTDSLVIEAAKRVVVMASRFHRPITINAAAQVMFAMNRADYPGGGPTLQHPHSAGVATLLFVGLIVPACAGLILAAAIKNFKAPGKPANAH